LRVEWSEQADRDRNGLVDYIAQDNPRAAVGVGDEITRQVAMLAEFPQMGRAGRIQGTREQVIAGTSYIVAYRLKGNAVQVLRVLHGAQQWPARFDVSPPER